MCTGISLSAEDGSVIAARTVEWAHSHSHQDRLVLYPSGHAFRGLTPDGENGHRWTGRVGFVALSSHGQPYGPDGLNEAGLSVGMYYFPGFASFAEYDPAQSDRAMSVGDLLNWSLSTCETVAEVRARIGEITVVNVDGTDFGGVPLPFHWKVADHSGASIVIEITHQGRVEIFDTVCGVVTNAPGYDWHLTNLRNYLGLHPEAEMPALLDGQKISPLGAGTGLRGLPGDFTPPARFVRAVTLTASARPLATASDAVFEAFRILDSFNIPIGASVPAENIPTELESATQITTAHDLTNRVIYFHTMSDRQVRKLDFSKIDFLTVAHGFIETGMSRSQTVAEIKAS